MTLLYLQDVHVLNLSFWSSIGHGSFNLRSWTLTLGQAPHQRRFWSSRQNRSPTNNTHFSFPLYNEQGARQFCMLEQTTKKMHQEPR